MIIWRGYGFLIAICFIVGLVVPTLTAQHFWGDPLPLGVRQSAELIGMLMAGGLAFALHLWLERSSQPRTVVDKQTQQELVLAPKHDLFFVPVKYWPYVFVGLGAWFFIQG